ncbi:zinc finger MYM-type protein 3 isoform X2 [Diorhabda sublineata]|uniref:zinc finger MYM-type protein 3 isoform X2 n=1 Tax=Diorhabda sublineata TaxID=1163346 RepID=UPI0024E1124D|nr:zinc finger MYM-type protein 3 isoform X2 [Diorhabda sublineata]
MEDYNSEALKTVEDVANSIPMGTSDMIKNDVLNELEYQKISSVNSDNQMGVISENIANMNYLQTGLESNMLHTTMNQKTEESSSVHNKELDIGSPNIESELEKNSSSAGDSIENIINSGTVDENSEKRMDCSENVIENFNTSDITSSSSFITRDSVSEVIENTCAGPDGSLHSDNNCEGNSQPIESCVIPESIIEKQFHQTSNPSNDLHESEINTFHSENSSKDKGIELAEQSPGLTMLEDLSEIPSESFPDLEPDKEKLTTDSEIATGTSDTNSDRELEIMDFHTESISTQEKQNKKPLEATTSANQILLSEEKSTDVINIDDTEKDDIVEEKQNVIETENSLESPNDNEEKQSQKTTSNMSKCSSNNFSENVVDNENEKEEVSATSKNFHTDLLDSNENREGADAELCIIPDTERVISQAEKEAASSIPPLRDIREASAQSQFNDIISPSDHNNSPIVVYKYEKDDLQICNECKLKRKVKYYCSMKDEETKYLCDDNCLTIFKSNQEDKVALNWEDGSLRVKDFSGVSKDPPSLSFIRRCAACNKETNDIVQNLTWEIMDFCNEFCLTKYQKDTGSYCSNCKGDVKSNSLGKYCVRFGNDIRQFCTSLCLEKYKKGLKVCSYCQQDTSGTGTGFLAPVGDKGQFKDFCSQACMEKYDIMTNDKPPKVLPGTICSVCKTEKTISIQFELDGIPNYFCGEPCFVAFCFVNNISPGKCAMCRRHFPKSILEKHTMYYDNVQHSFCSTSCENIYIISHRKIVPCSWCKVKKYNFDMIRRYSKVGSVINMCSVNCLGLYRLSIETNLRQDCCNFCQKSTHAMYHLSMSDSSVRNFCSYNCVINFQNQYPKQLLAVNSGEYPIPTGIPRKNKKFHGSDSAVPGDAVPIPMITSVQSLANTNGTLGNSSTVPPSLTPINSRSTRSKSSLSSPVINSTPQVINSFSEIPFQVQIKHHFIVRPAPLPEQRNVSTMCYTHKLNKGITAKPTVMDQEVQTEEREAKKILIPVPVPIYVPTPMHMYSTPTPVPVPIPVPIPIPIFIPTTRNSAAGIMKEIKKIQVKIPTDPYEAELLMMAEMVAEEKKDDITDSESDVDDSGGPEDSYSPEPVDHSNTFGDDMLQMALKMATELDEPAVDLEGALTANTITGGEQHHNQDENVDDPQPLHHHMIDRSPSARGRKRGMRQSRGGAKRGRRMSHHQVDMPMMQHHQVQQPPPPPEPAEKPDANMCLKYTFGVNAWKQWVTTKNAELEKTRLVKLFKTEILQLTADELNFSLCLFVKEVRKPNGAEYAPDTIYYLCLGIQQYLFENGRIDNIFCDPYYEKFTDCLDEVAKKFSVLYNDSHYIVTRVEEEHLWESKQLGAHSPHVLLSTLMFFNTKHFNLTSVDEHMQLSFSHIMKHWKRNPNQPGASKVPGSRNVLLRFYPPQSAIQNNARKKKVYEQQENEENPLRCPVKLYEFYLSKCPESVKTRNDVFYLQPERSCVPDSPVWYSTMPLPREALEKMLHRVKMVKEINVALLTS